MREILVDITQKYGCTVLISSHILGELEKIATHYGIIRQGKMIMEISAEEMDSRAQVFVSLKTRDMEGAEAILRSRYPTLSPSARARLLLPTAIYLNT
jgi:ABC-2 type transport system ATP-binding protein